MKPANHEHYFIEQIKKGYLRVDNNGKIFRIAIKNRWHSNDN